MAVSPLVIFVVLQDGKKVAVHAGELEDPEAFLSAFMRTQAWRDDDEAPMKGWGRVGAGEEDESASESDVEDVEAVEQFEAKYNFRFEDPAGAQVRDMSLNLIMRLHSLFSRVLSHLSSDRNALSSARRFCATKRHQATGRASSSKRAEGC